MYIRFFCNSILAACLSGLLVAGDATGQDENKAPQAMTVQLKPYGQTESGQKITEFTCRNSHGLEMKLINYGATMTSMSVPDADGKMANIILHCSNLSGYEKCKSYFGCIAGRYCNRIAKGRFELDGKTYQLATNNGPNHLHGGNVGFDKLVWDAEPIEEDYAVGVRFTITSPDGDEGYPGTVTATAEYRLTNDDELAIDLLAVTDAPTHVNLTNHNYWNLAGAGDVLSQVLTIHADEYLPVDDTMIPTGELKSVAGSPLDFRNPTAIGDRIGKLRDSAAKGYDHCYVIKPTGDQVRLAASVVDPKSHRRMEIWTNQPGLQFYSGNFLDGSEGSGGYPVNSAFCLESEYFPDTPNQKQFPSSLLRPNQTYHSETVIKFSVESPQPKSP